MGKNCKPHYKKCPKGNPDTTANKIGLTGKPGQPRYEQTLVKKQLFSNLSPTANIPKRSVNEYLRRKIRQMKRSPTIRQRRVRNAKSCGRLKWNNSWLTIPDVCLTRKTPFWLMEFQWQRGTSCRPNTKSTCLSRSRIHTSYKASQHFVAWFLDVSCRRVCVRTKDYNLDQKVDAVNKLATSMKMPSVKFTTRELSKHTLCHYDGTPSRKCVDRLSSMWPWKSTSHIPTTDRRCRNQECCVPSMGANKDNYTDKKGNTKICNKWKQIGKSVQLTTLVDDIAEVMKIHLQSRLPTQSGMRSHGSTTSESLRDSYGYVTWHSDG